MEDVALQFERKEKYTVDDLLKIMEILRSPEGCPWDREQTHKSIRNNMIEETYEAVEAIDNGNQALLEEELGDMLFQVVFHAQLEKEKDSFDFSDVVDGVAKKMVERHPFVFGTSSVKNSSEALESWNKVKMRTKGRRTLEEVLKGVSPALPALMRSQRLQKKAAGAAGKTFSKDEKLSDLHEAVEQVEQLPEAAGEKAKLQKIGKLLFAVSALSESLGIEAEEALAQYCSGFVRNCGKAV